LFFTKLLNNLPSRRNANAGTAASPFRCASAEAATEWLIDLHKLSAMRKILLAFIFICTSSLLFAQTNSDTSRHFTFKGVTIDGTLDDFIVKLKKSGLTFVSTKDGVAQFKGEFSGYSNCTIYAISHKNLIYRVGVIFPIQSTWSGLSDNYFNLKRLLIEKYGEFTAIVKEEFQNPYVDDDDNSKMHEVRMGRCKYSLTTGTAEGVIELSISNIGVSNCFVKLIYEDKINSKIKEQQSKDDL
jgi:hypothetical protein